jgi:hypothetical protein
MRRIQWCIGAVCLLAVGVIGCSGENTNKQVAEMNKSNGQRLSNLYAAYQNVKGGKGPKSEAEFKEFIKAYGAERLKPMGVDLANLDQLFTSENDGKTFKIRYNVGGGRGSVDAVIFEQDGKEGLKQVTFTGGKVESVDEVAYKSLWEGKPSVLAAGSNKGGPPPGGRPSGRPTGAPTGPGK